MKLVYPSCCSEYSTFHWIFQFHGVLIAIFGLNQPFLAKNGLKVLKIMKYLYLLNEWSYEAGLPLILFRIFDFLLQFSISRCADSNSWLKLTFFRLKMASKSKKSRNTSIFWKNGHMKLVSPHFVQNTRLSIGFFNFRVFWLQLMAQIRHFG